MRGFVLPRKGRTAGPAGSAQLLRTTQTSLMAALGLLLLSGPCLAQNGGPFDFIRLADEIRAAQQTAPAAEPGLAASDIILLRQALLLHRLSAQFYNINADAAFLTGATPVTNPPTFNPGTIAGAGPGFFDGGSTTAGSTTAGSTTAGGTTAGSTTAGTTTAGSTTAGITTAGSTTAGSTTAGTTTAGETTAGTTTAGLTTAGITTAGTTTAGSTTGGTTTAGSTTAGSTTAGSTTAGTTTAGSTTGGTVTPGSETGNTGATTSSLLPALRNIIQEIRTHHNAHVALLEQALGSNAPQPPTFQNLQATNLQQFLEMAQMMEDLSVSAHQGMMPQIQSDQVMNLMEGIGLVEGRHAGAIRTYRKIASTAEGGDPNLTLTEDGGAVNNPRTWAQVVAAIQPFLAPGTVLPGSGTVIGNNTGTNNGTGTGP